MVSRIGSGWSAQGVQGPRAGTRAQAARFEPKGRLDTGVKEASDVVALPPESVKPAPELGASLDTRYITGLGTLNDQMLILVDIEKLIGSDELQIVDATVENSQREAANQ